MFTTCLFTPGLRVDQIRKSVSSGVDLCIVDLEDSISPRRKEEARALLGETLLICKPVDVRMAVRVNSVLTEDGVLDLLALKNAPLPPELLVLPKIESASEIAIVEALLGSRGQKIDFVVLIETHVAVEAVHAIVKASQRIKALMFGAADYARSVGVEPGWESLLYPRSRIAAAARGYALAAIDTPYFNISDLAGLEEDTTKARRLGYTGRAAIHPSQLDVIRRCFALEADRRARARRIVEAAEGAGGDICVVNGQMIGAPIVLAAKALLGIAN